MYDHEVRLFRFMAATEGSLTLKSTLSRGITGGGTVRVELMTATELRLFLLQWVFLNGCCRPWGRVLLEAAAAGCGGRSVDVLGAWSSSSEAVVSVISLGTFNAGAGEVDRAGLLWWMAKLLLRVELDKDALCRFTYEERERERGRSELNSTILSIQWWTPSTLYTHTYPPTHTNGIFSDTWHYFHLVTRGTAVNISSVTSLSCTTQYHKLVTGESGRYQTKRWYVTRIAFEIKENVWSSAISDTYLSK